MKRIRLLDTTLSEGEQILRGSFTIRQKLIIARSLDFLGIDGIEVGQPGVSGEIDEFIAEVNKEQLRAELIVHARACRQDVEAALNTGISRITVYMESAGWRLCQESQTGIDQAVRLVYRSIAEIVASGRKVSFLAGDITSVDVNILIELCRAAAEAGADSINLPDNRGIVIPDEVRSIFLCVKSIFPELSLGAPCRNNLGLAVDNALAAMEGGADCLHVTVNGPGNGTAITPLRHLAVALKVQYGIDTVDMPSVHELSRMVSRFSGVPLIANQPVAGVKTSAVSRGQ